MQALTIQTLRPVVLFECLVGNAQAGTGMTQALWILWLNLLRESLHTTKVELSVQRGGGIITGGPWTTDGAYLAVDKDSVIKGGRVCRLRGPARWRALKGTVVAQPVIDLAWCWWRGEKVVRSREKGVSRRVAGGAGHLRA